MSPAAASPGISRQAFDIAGYYYQQRHRIVEDAGILNALIDATRAGHDLTPNQWAQWYSVALGFQPDLIVELGRAKGNSTALFCQAASRLGGTRVVSLCSSRDWVDETLPQVASGGAGGLVRRARRADRATFLTSTTRRVVRGLATRPAAMGRARIRDCGNRSRADPSADCRPAASGVDARYQRQPVRGGVAILRGPAALEGLDVGQGDRPIDQPREHRVDELACRIR